MYIPIIPVIVFCLVMLTIGTVLTLAALTADRWKDRIK
jgi:hypothetical protein